MFLSVADRLIVMLTFASLLVEMLSLIIVIILAIRDKK
ncbi:TPA: putative holin-like toxin [Streptococcus suis]